MLQLPTESGRRAIANKGKIHKEASSYVNSRSIEPSRNALTKKALIEILQK
jgi:hypothetical protein